MQTQYSLQYANCQYLIHVKKRLLARKCQLNKQQLKYIQYTNKISNLLTDFKNNKIINYKK